MTGRKSEASTIKAVGIAPTAIPAQTPLIVYLLAQTNFPLSRLIAKPMPFAIPAPST